MPEQHGKDKPTSTKTPEVSPYIKRRREAILKSLKKERTKTRPRKVRLWKKDKERYFG